MNQLGAESLTHLKKLASNVTSSDAASNVADGKSANDDGAEARDEQDDDDDDDDDVPDLVENFDEASKEEGIVQGELLVARHVAA